MNDTLLRRVYQCSYLFINPCITVVENINKRREPFPLMSGIYFLGPSQNSVAKLIDDFSLSAQPQYKEAHVFFSSALHPAMLGHIKACTGLVSRLKSLKEVWGCC